jgi:hypothetical protein
VDRIDHAKLKPLTREIANPLPSVILRHAKSALANPTFFAAADQGVWREGLRESGLPNPGHTGA